MLIPLADIVVEERIREDFGSQDEQSRFKASFGKVGQLQPIKVEQREDGRWKLIAGERRLRAITALSLEGKCPLDGKLGFIEASSGPIVPLHTKLLQEFAENNDRKDFNFIEKARFIRRFHDMMTVDMGDSWTQEMTAHSLNLSPASISHYLRVEQAAKEDASIGRAKTLDAAVKRMKVQESLKNRHEAAKDDNNAFQRAASILTHGDAREWIRTIEDESVDFVNFDPPWGDNASFKSAENHEAFDDSTEYAEGLMADLLPEIYRILKPDRFCAFWFRAWSSERMAALSESFGFNLQFTRTPCIWFKPDKITDQNRTPEKQLIEAYEMFYLLRKGNPIFHERFANNVFPFDRVPLGSIIHPTEKPLDLMDALVRLTTVPGESVFDPTAGSSAALDAAIRASRKAKGCELSERYHERGVTRLAEYLKGYSEQ